MGPLAAATALLTLGSVFLLGIGTALLWISS